MTGSAARSRSSRRGRRRTCRGRGPRRSCGSPGRRWRTSWPGSPAEAAAGLRPARRAAPDRHRREVLGQGSDKYLMIVTDHDAGRDRLDRQGRCQAAVERSSTPSARNGRRLLTHVSADGAEWIHDVVRAEGAAAQICLDAFHIVKWAGEGLDELRRRLAGELRAAGGGPGRHARQGHVGNAQGSGKLTPGQRGALAVIAADNKQLYKGYLIKEQLREAFKVKGADGKTLLRGMTPGRTGAGSPSSSSSRRPSAAYEDAHLPHSGRRPFERPGRGAECPGQRPDHPGTRLPQRRRPDGHDRLRARWSMPRFALDMNINRYLRTGESRQCYVTFA